MDTCPLFKLVLCLVLKCKFFRGRVIKLLYVCAAVQAGEQMGG